MDRDKTLHPSARSSAGQGRFSGQRPTFYRKQHCAAKTRRVIFAVETNVDASDADIQITITHPPHCGIIRRTAIDEHRFTMADVDNGSVTYECKGNSSEDDFRFVVNVGAVESSGAVIVHVTNVTSQTPAPNLLHVVANVVAVVDELGTIQLSPQVLKVV